MAWLKVPMRGGVLKIKPFWQIRRAEREGRIPILHLGLIIFAWWSTERLREYGEL